MLTHRCLSSRPPPHFSMWPLILQGLPSGITWACLHGGWAGGWGMGRGEGGERERQKEEEQEEEREGGRTSKRS